MSLRRCGPRGRSSSPEHGATRFPLTAFLTMAIGLSYPLMSLAIMAQYSVIPGKSLPSLIGLDMDRAASALLVASLIVATFLTTALHGGRPSRTGSPSADAPLARPARGWLVAVVALPATTVALAVAFADSAHIPSGGVIARDPSGRGGNTGSGTGSMGREEQQRQQINSRSTAAPTSISERQNPT